MGLFFFRPDESFYLRQIVRITGLGQGAVQRELKRLTEAGLLIRVEQGRQVYYQVNRESPIFDELRKLMTKTSGLADLLQEELTDLADQIELAIIYGSQANGKAVTSSDVDLLIVGDVEELKLHRAITRAEKKLARTVNYMLFARQEYERRREEKGGFLERVLKGAKIFIVGTDEDV